MEYFVSTPFFGGGGKNNLIGIYLNKMLSDLIPGETMEIDEAYIGQNQKLPARVIIHRLTDDQTQTRLKNQAIREKKKGIVIKLI